MSQNSDAIADRLRGSSRPADRLEASVVRAVLSRLPDLPVVVVLPSGVEIAPTRGSAAFRLTFRTHAAVASLAMGNRRAIGDLFCSGQLEVEGDLAGLLAEIDRMTVPTNNVLRRWRRWTSAVRRIGPQRAARNARHHYDRNVEFFAAWLDPSMTYTCAFFADETMTLAEAQTAKLERICAKLRLRPGETVIDAGCGWGALAMHMARRHGARVRAFNVSLEQVEWARRRARDEGLHANVEFVHSDYRNISGRADAFVSVGMLEHIGPRQYAEFGSIVAASIGTGGRALVHTIGRVRPTPTDDWIERRIFPDGYAPSLAEAMHVFEPNDLAVVHMENLRRDYALTLAHWLSNFEAAAAGPLSTTDPVVLRTWRLYLASSLAAFASGWAQLFQLLVAPRANTGFRGPGR